MESCKESSTRGRSDEGRNVACKAGGKVIQLSYNRLYCLYLRLLCQRLNRTRGVKNTTFKIRRGTQICCPYTKNSLQANEKVGEAIYQSDWSSSLFGRSGNLSTGQIASLKQVMMMVQIRALRPQCIKVLFFGKTGHSFLMGYFKTFYSYFQALLNFL